MTAGPPHDRLYESFITLIGSEHVRSEPDIDVAGLRPQLIASPGTPAEVAACLLAARDHGAAVIPLGGGTLQRLGYPPQRADVLLDCRRLTGVVDWEPADLTAGLLAGTPLGVAQARLAEQGQQLAIDAPMSGRATIGGLVAANVAGPRRWLHGGWRDQIIGMEMAITNGEVIKSGGRVVKNVQGYDLAKLFTGSLGTLGVIARVNVKLVPISASRTLIVARGSSGRLDSMLARVADSPLRVSTLDLLDAAAAGQCGLDTGEDAALLLIEGSPAFTDGQAARLERLARDLGLAVEALAESLSQEVFQRWLDLERVDDLDDREALLGIAGLPSEAEPTMRAIQDMAAERGLTCRCWLHAGDGTVCARLAGQEVDFGAQLLDLQAALLVHHPATSLICGDPAIQQTARVWGADPDGLALMHRLKERFDPTCTLQPGRFAGGI